MRAERSLAATIAPAPAAECTVAEAVARAIAAAGIEIVFAFPGGGSNLLLIDALSSAGVRVVLTRSEEGGAFMASTYGELRRLPGVLLTSLGPGAASAVNGAAHALLDRAPLLIISDRHSAAEAATSTHQLLDQRRLFAPVTKWQAEIATEDAYATTEQAIAIATAAPRGGVQLELAHDVARTPTQTGPPRPESDASEPLDADRIRTAAKAIAAARRPVLLVGLEARYHRFMQGALTTVAERLPAPVLSTYKAKGVFPETHPLSAGIVTGAEIERSLLEQADLIVTVGLDPVELLPRPWPHAAPIIALREHALQDGHLPSTQTLVGRTDALLAALADPIEAPRSEWTQDRISAIATESLERLRVPSADGPAAWEIVEAVAAAASPETIVAVDAGAHMFAATSFWRATRPDGFLISNGLSTMGYAVPAAVAAALVEPERPVIAFTGDGGFLLHANELETAARTGASVVVVVLNDACLSLIRVKQDDAALERRAVDFLSTDFASLAQSLGGSGARATTVAEARDAVAHGLAQGGPFVVDVTISGAEYRETIRRIRG